MAERRMFAKTIIDSDAFLDMPLSTQALYFHLSMRADDDGFINNPKKIQRMVGASDDDGKLLVLKKFIIPFESGVVVIKHWKIHNYIRNDRYKETNYKEEKATLSLDENNSYTTKNNVGIPNGYQWDTQDRIGKDSIGKDNKNISEAKETFATIIANYTNDLKLQEALKDYVEMRKKTKGFTTRALKLNLKELDKLTNDDVVKLEIVNQTIMNSWKSFYPLKTNNKPFNNQKEKVPQWFIDRKNGVEETTQEVSEEQQKELDDLLKKIRG